MPGAATTYSFPYHQDREIWKIAFNEYMRQKLDYVGFAKVGDAPKGSGGGYTEAQLSPLGELQAKAEEDGIVFTTPVEGNKKTVTPTVYALGFRQSLENTEDDIFGHFKQKVPEELGKSGAYKPEVMFWQMFNYPTATTYHSGIDSLAMLSDSHKTLKSEETIDNLGAAAVLSETTLQAGFEYFDDVVDDQGRPIRLTPKYLVTGNSLRFDAEKLLRNFGSIGTPNNDLNTVNPSNGIVNPYTIIRTPQITSTTSYFLVAEEHDFRLWWLRKMNMAAWDDPNTTSRLYAVNERFFVFFMDYRPVWGSTGA